MEIKGVGVIGGTSLEDFKDAQPTVFKILGVVGYRKKADGYVGITAPGNVGTILIFESVEEGKRLLQLSGEDTVNIEWFDVAAATGETLKSVLN